jgi:hypothetical protein
MLRRLIALLGLPILLSAAVSAQEIKTIERVVLGETRTRILIFYALDPNCSPTGTVTLRIIKQPANGTLESDHGPAFPEYPKDGIRFKCNSQETDAIRLWYQSKPGFKGRDPAELEVFYPNGGYLQAKLSVVVK